MRRPVPIDTAVLLGAARSARLRPWTERTPEALLVHRGRPTLDLILDSLARAGVTRVALVIHHLAEQLIAYAASRRAIGGQEIVCIRQDRLFGTAHALQCVMYARPELLVTPFLLSATDYLVPSTFYDELLRFHDGHDAALSVSLRRLGEDAAARSSVRFAAGPGDPSTRDILEIVEKPSVVTAPAIGANLCFVLPPELLAQVGETGVSVRGEREIQSTVNAWLSGGGRARGLLRPAPPEWQPEGGARS